MLDHADGKVPDMAQNDFRGFIIHQPQKHHFTCIRPEDVDGKRHLYYVDSQSDGPVRISPRLATRRCLAAAKINPLSINGIYEWQGSELTNGKPTYQLKENLLYWESTNKVWTVRKTNSKDQSTNCMDTSIASIDTTLYWMAALNTLKKADTDEVKNFKKPSATVVLIISAVCDMMEVKPGKADDPDNPGKKIQKIKNSQLSHA